MRALVQDRYGSTEVLELREIEGPAVGEDDVLIRVQAAGVDQGVWHLLAGLPYVVRLAGYGLRAPKKGVRGEDVAGRVERVGAAVTHFSEGDEVFGTCEGAFAELAVSKAETLALKPANLTFIEAAAVPTSAVTALQGLRDKGDVQPGQRALVIGAAGGVGSFAVQLAKVMGAHVTGVCSAGKVDLVRSLGADAVIDYTRQDIADLDDTWDVILDIAGNRSLRSLRRALTPRGTLVIVGGEKGGRLMGGTDRQLRALALSPFVAQRLRTYVAAVNSDDLDYLRALIETEAIRPAVDRTYPLSETPTAIRELREGRVRGKVVVTA